MKKSVLMALLASTAKAEEATTATDALSILKGLAEGALDAEGIEILHCASDVETVAQDTIAAVKDFEKGGVLNDAKGVIAIGKALSSARHALKECHAVQDIEKLAKMATIFSNPVHFLEHMGLDLAVNGVSIYGQIKQAIADYKGDQWEAFGHDLGEATALVFLGKMSQDYLEEMRKENVSEIVKGALKSFQGDFDVDRINGCIGQDDNISLLIDWGINKLDQAQVTKEKEQIISGISLIIAGLSLVDQDLSACNGVDLSSFNYDGFRKSLEIAEFPLEYFSIADDELRINNLEITKPLVDAYGLFKSEQYEAFGSKIGSIIDLANNKPIEKLDMRQVAARVAEGFFKGASIGTPNQDAFTSCVLEADYATAILDTSVQLIEQALDQEDYEVGWAGFATTVQFIQQFRQSAQFCESFNGQLDWSKFDDIYQTFDYMSLHNEEAGFVKIEPEAVEFLGENINGKLEMLAKTAHAQKWETYGWSLAGLLNGQARSLKAVQRLPAVQELFLY